MTADLPSSASPHAAPASRRGLDFSPTLARVSCLRVLMLGWCLWLLGSWAMAVMLDGPKLGGRWLIYAVMVGLMLGWPAMRLSQPRMPGRSALAEALGEWLCLMLVLQAVIWPLRLTTGWTMVQSAWLDAALAGWSALTAVVIAWGRMTDHGLLRGLAMILCVALVLGAPQTATLSPIQVLWALSSLHPPVAAGPWRAPIISVAVAALAGVVVLGGWSAVGRDKPQQAED